MYQCFGFCNSSFNSYFRTFAKKVQPVQDKSKEELPIYINTLLEQIIDMKPLSKINIIRIQELSEKDKMLIIYTYNNVIDSMQVLFDIDNKKMY